MTMSKQQIREGHAVDDDVRDYPSWVRSFLDGCDPETRRKIFEYELLRLYRRFALALTRRPPADLGSLDTPQSDGDRGSDARPHVNLGHDGVAVVDANEAGVVVGGECSGDEQCQ